MNLEKFGFDVNASGSQVLADVWVRPSNWLPRPDISGLNQCVTFLLAVFPNSENTFSYQCGGATVFQIIDGSSTNVNSFTTYNANFDFNTINSPIVGTGYKMVWVCITPQAGHSITSFILGYFPSKFIDSQVKLPFGTFNIGHSGAAQRFPMWESLSLISFIGLSGTNGLCFGQKMRNLEINSFPASITTLVSGLSISGFTIFDNLFPLTNVLNLQTLYNNSVFLRYFKSSTSEGVTNWTNAFAYSNIRYFEANMAGATTVANMFLGTEIEWVIATGLRYGTTLNSCNMSATALNAFMTSLGIAVGAQTLDLRGNPGSATCNPVIATAKGFTVLIA